MVLEVLGAAWVSAILVLLLLAAAFARRDRRLWSSRHDPPRPVQRWLPPTPGG